MSEDRSSPRGARVGPQGGLNARERVLGRRAQRRVGRVRPRRERPRIVLLARFETRRVVDTVVWQLALLGRGVKRGEDGALPPVGGRPAAAFPGRPVGGFAAPGYAYARWRCSSARAR